jgi:hypothetical protein
MAIRTFNSVAGFSVGETPSTIITAEGNVTTGNVLTDNLLHANGEPWDFNNAAGSDTQIQYKEGSDLAASANLTFNATTNILTVAGNANVTTNLIVPNITTPTSTNLVIAPGSGGVVSIAAAVGGSTGIQVGTPTQGNLTSNAVVMTSATTVTNGIAQLNEILGKLVPPSPPSFPASQSISIQSLSSYRMSNFTQTDSTQTGGRSVAGGTTVSTVRRASSYNTNTVTNAGPGNTGKVTVYLNGVDAGNVTLSNTLTGAGTYGNLVISNNVDYRVVNASIQAGFWSVFSANATGSVTEGWNEVKIGDSAASNTNTTAWYYDASSPGTPSFTSTSITPPNSPTYTYSSTVPHYDSSNQFTISFSVNRLSGDMYPTNDTFVTGTAGGAFQTPASVTYAGAGITTPLARNLYVASGSQSVSTTAYVVTGFGSSSGTPSVTVTNSYNSATQTFTPSGTVLYKTGTGNTMEETAIVFGSTVGSGSGSASRIVNPGSTNTPAISASAALFNSQSGTLQTYDAKIVSGTLKNDTTNYSSGYLPVGPDFSSHGAAQYFTFRFVRTSVSKFDIKWTGTLAGLWIALPGSTFDTSSTINGWLDLSIPYAGAGVPGAGVGGNGSNGASLGGTAPVGAAQTNKRITATFGTVSSSSTSTNEIYVRIRLNTGQSITALSLETASN